MTTNNMLDVALSGSTGTGNFVGATSPTLVTPALGTPSSGTLTSCTGLPVSTGISGLGTGVATALAAGVTGSGNVALATSPTFVTPTLGAASATSINFGQSTLSNYTALTSWTPVFTFATPGDVSVSYAVQTGWYARIGNIITVGFNLSCTPTYTTSSGNLTITGLPVAASASGGTVTAGVLVASSNIYPAGTVSPVLFVQAAATSITLFGQGTTSTGASFTTAHALTATSILIRGTFSYIA